MVERVECVVAGAGAVGLAVARALARAGREVVVLEAAEAIGTVTSSRNSEVIHAGIYYPAGSLKARLCVAGRRALYDYCRERGVAHRNTGKLIVATEPAQLPALERIRAAAAANGVDDLTLLPAAAAGALEPALRCVAALLSPSTGIVDSHGFMLALRGDAEAHGATIAFLSPIVGGRVGGGGIELDVGGREPTRLGCRLLVNCAGLGAHLLAASLAGFPRERVPPLFLAKGNYYALSGVRPPFGRLVYPVPESAGLGVHVTLDLAGQCRFGPDVEWIERIDYDVDPARAAAFYAAVRAYWPGLPDGSLVPAYAGIRPKLAGKGVPASDFVVQGAREHGVPGVVNLFGIESPGLTAAIALAEHVVRVAEGSMP